MKSDGYVSRSINLPNYYFVNCSFDYPKKFNFIFRRFASTSSYFFNFSREKFCGEIIREAFLFFFFFFSRKISRTDTEISVAVWSVIFSAFVKNLFERPIFSLWFQEIFPPELSVVRTKFFRLLFFFFFYLFSYSVVLAFLSLKFNIFLIFFFFLFANIYHISSENCSSRKLNFWNGWGTQNQTLLTVPDSKNSQDLMGEKKERKENLSGMAKPRETFTTSHKLFCAMHSSLMPTFWTLAWNWSNNKIFCA